MSEIFSPGSIAGPQGVPGPAGSASSVSALASALVPTFVGRNLFDPTQGVAGMYVNADGVLTAASGFTASGLIYCPGAVSAIANVPIDFNIGYIACYDANGNFLSSEGATYYGGLGLMVGGPNAMASETAFPLPGTQTYIQFCWEARWGGNGWAASAASGALYMVTSGTATWLGYQACGLDTLAAALTREAAIAANAQAALVSSLSGAIELAVNSLLPSPASGSRNVFDYKKAMQNTGLSNTGVFAASSGWTSALVYAPGATSFCTNLPLRGPSNGFSVCVFDANGNFIESVDSTLASDYAGAGYPDGVLAVNGGGTAFPLPGTQTYVGFTFSSSNLSGGFFASSMERAGFFAGTTANPPVFSYRPFAGNAPVSVKTASQLGCPLDSNLAPYTGGGTDVTTILNAFLATASAANPVKLILDGACLTSGLAIAAPGYTTIEGIGRGSGLALTAAATAGIIVAAQGPGAYNVTAPAQSSAFVGLRNFTITPAGSGGYAGIQLADCTDIVIENVTVTGTMAADDFSIALSNVSRARIAGCSFITGGYGHDGVHCDGLCTDIAISDCYFATGDDAIALNAPEGYGGDISRVTVTNCRFNNSLTVMRIYTSLDPAAMATNNVHTVRDVVVSNCTGSVTSMCFNLGISEGLSATTGADQLHDLTVSNCTFAAPQGLALLLTPIGSLVFRGVAFIPTGASSLINGTFSSVGELVLDDVRVIRNGDGSSVLDSFVNVASGIAMDRVSLLNCRAVDEEGSSYTPHTSLIDNSGTIAALRLESIDLTNVAALFSTAGTSGITLLRGAGVLGTGTQVPDAAMDNNCLYLSSTASGAPSIKVGGTAKRLTLA